MVVLRLRGSHDRVDEVSYSGDALMISTFSFSSAKASWPMTISGS